MSLLTRQQFEMHTLTCWNRESEQALLAHDASQRALLRQREEEIERLKQQVVPAPFDESHPDPNEIIATLNAQLAAMVEQRAQDGLDGQAALDMLNNQLSTSQARCAEAIEALHALYDVQMWWAVGKGE